MVVVAGGIIPTRDPDFLLGRGENNGGEDSRCCNAIFGPGNRITNATVEVLCLISDKRGGGRQQFAYEVRPLPQTKPRTETLSLHAFLFCATVLLRRAQRRS